MKKTLGLFAAAMLLVGGVAFADEAMLIDFTLLDADCCEDENGNATQNKHTIKRPPTLSPAKPKNLSHPNE